MSRFVIFSYFLPGSKVLLLSPLCRSLPWIPPLRKPDRGNIDWSVTWIWQENNLFVQWGWIYVAARSNIILPNISMISNMLVFAWQFSSWSWIAIIANPQNEFVLWYVCCMCKRLVGRHCYLVSSRSPDCRCLGVPPCCLTSTCTYRGLKVPKLY